MIKRIILVILPVYLVLAEGFVRTFLLHETTDADSTLGPSITIAGIGLLLPVLVPKEMELQILDPSGKPAKARVPAPGDVTLSQIGWICLIFLAGVWIWCLCLNHENPQRHWFDIPAPVVIGAVTYLIGAALAEAKEWS